LEFLQGKQEVEAVGDVFSHADDAAAAELEIVALHALTRFPALVVSVGRADLGKIAARRLKVVVDFIDAGSREPLDLEIVQNPERNGDGQRQLGFDLLDRGADAFQQFFRRPAHGDDDAELTSTTGECGASRRDKILDARKRLGLDIGCITRALRAKIAIFRTTALLGVVEHFDGNLVAAVVGAHVIGKRQESRYVFGGKLGNAGEQLGARRAAALEQLGSRALDRGMRHISALASPKIQKALHRLRPLGFRRAQRPERRVPADFPAARSRRRLGTWDPFGPSARPARRRRSGCSARGRGSTSTARD